MTTTLVWFRQDLRLSDNPALLAAAARGAVVPVFIWSPTEEGDWPVGGAGRWWLGESLARLARDLERRGVTLVIRSGVAAEELERLRRQTGADALYWNRRYEPAAIERDAAIKTAWRQAGVMAVSFNANLLCEPWELLNKSGRPFQVFTPFWRQLVATMTPSEPAGLPGRLRGPRIQPESLPLEDLELKPRPDWAGTLREAWQPGEAGAIARLERFLAEGLLGYSEQRDRPDMAGTARLSPHLHWGEISPRLIWHANACRRCQVEQCKKSEPLGERPAATVSRGGDRSPADAGRRRALFT